MSINPLFRDHINFRDLGGYASRDGRKVKYGLLYRSGGIYLMNQEELNTLSSLGVHSIMDLRTSEESKVSPDPIIPGISAVRHSGVTFRGGEEIDFSPVGMSKIGKEGHEQLALLQTYYSEIPFDNQALRVFMDKLSSGHVPMVFHCHTGKDRTGVFAMVVLLALGVDDETVLQDFLLSNDYHREAIQEALEESRDRISNHPELEELIRMRTGVTEKIGRSVLYEIHSRYPSIDDYLKNEFQMSDNQIVEFRNKFLE